jgi:hypothetical protein
MRGLSVEEVTLITFNLIAVMSCYPLKVFAVYFQVDVVFGLLNNMFIHKFFSLKELANHINLILSLNMRRYVLFSFRHNETFPVSLVLILSLKIITIPVSLAWPAIRIVPLMLRNRILRM